MPLIDVSDVIDDVEFSDTFTVVRRLEQVGNDGVSALQLYKFPNVSGEVYPTSPNALQQTPDARRTQKSITVVTKFRLRGTAQNEVQQTYQPDLVIWAGEYFQVEAPNDYSRYGAGFIEAVCIAISTQDLPPDFPAQVIGAKVFSNPQNSNLVD